MPQVNKILMFGWEFPPFNSGGLGVACSGLVKALHQEGKEVIFVLPKKLNCQSDFCKLVFADDLEVFQINSLLTPYITQRDYGEMAMGLNEHTLYSSDLFGEVFRYAKAAQKIIEKEQFDIIHAHDWLCLLAGILAKKKSGKPLVAHIHATEFDRTGGRNINQAVYNIEKQGLEIADAVIAVSNFTKEKIIEHYSINPAKIFVAHNGVERNDNSQRIENLAISKNSKLVLFLGRLTLQKGPDYFLLAAKKVLEKMPDVYFLVAGAGDMEGQLINLAIDLGISDKVIFTGFLRGEQLKNIYRSADLYVLPSVSEPFGITVLEAIQQGTPVLISKQSGASEVVNHCLKVDFWDIDQMAAKILAVLRYSPLKDELRENSLREIDQLSWRQTASKCLAVYDKVLS